MKQNETAFIALDGSQLEWLENSLEQYDNDHIATRTEGHLKIGITVDGELAGGVDACMTAFHILYVSTVYVDEKYRGMGLGKRLMQETERQAKALGANLIRLDTFDWQGAAFYRALGYEQVGAYDCPEDGFAEYFFLKRI